ncbi:MAG: CoA transferase [Clostridia bacterium]|jgi:CoA:oxalate CoA-transferase|nr:CoA transferase [Clostridia bacterium]
MGLFNGVKVIDFTHAYAGPFCSLNLGDFGADVIKIERVDGGDQARAWGPFKNGRSGYYASFNSGKKSITLNIASKEGQKIVFDLVKEADIVCSNFKAGTLEKYGIGYDEMKVLKPDIIYATISGFGSKGELSKLAAYDNVVQAMSGIMDLNGFPDKRPTKIGPAIGDSYSGLMLLLGIVIAYYYRLKTGEGQKVDVTMLGSLFSMLEYPILEYANKGKIYSRIGNKSLYYAPCDVYKTKDNFVAVTVKNNDMWNTFATKLGIEKIDKFSTNEGRLKYNDELKKIIESKFSSMLADDIENMFVDTDIPVAKIMGIAEALTDKHLNERDMVVEVKDPIMGPVKLVGNPIKLSENKPVLNRPSPKLGENTDEILKGIGFNNEQIKTLRKKGVI